MVIRYRLYPYPVLAKFNDDYVDSSFSISASIEVVGFEIIVNLTAELVNDGLKELIETGKATFLYHAECSNTGYREIKESADLKEKMVIREDRLNGTLCICPFIISKKDLSDYKNSQFNPDYSAPIPFIAAGSILAVGEAIEFPIIKKKTDMIDSSSPFRIVANPDGSQSAMIVEYQSSEYIKIFLSKDDYNNVFNLNGSPTLKPILTQMTIVPALVYVLGKIAHESNETLEEFERNTHWFPAIKQILKHSFNTDITQLSEANVLELAQKMMKTPIGQGVSELVSIGARDQDEDDEDTE